jgi:hypothetical protein
MTVPTKKFGQVAGMGVAATSIDTEFAIRCASAGYSSRMRGKGPCR